MDGRPRRSDAAGHRGGARRLSHRLSCRAAQIAAIEVGFRGRHHRAFARPVAREIRGTFLTATGGWRQRHHRQQFWQRLFCRDRIDKRHTHQDSRRFQRYRTLPTCCSGVHCVRRDRSRRALYQATTINPADLKLPFRPCATRASPPGPTSRVGCSGLVCMGTAGSATDSDFETVQGCAPQGGTRCGGPFGAR